MAGQFLDQQHLVNIVASQSVRRGHHNDIKIGQRRMITQPVQSRPAKTSAAITVVTIDMALIQHPPPLSHRRRAARDQRG